MHIVFIFNSLLCHLIALILIHTVATYVHHSVDNIQALTVMQHAYNFHLTVKIQQSSSVAMELLTVPVCKQELLEVHF